MTIPSTLYPVHRIRGVLLLTVFLSAVFTVEFLLATMLGFPDTRTMLSVLSKSEKLVLVSVAGPLLHQDTSHLVQNLVFLVVFGGFVEWHLGWRRLIGYSAAIGYVATWAILMTGSVGAVGASSVTNGLEAVTGFVAFVGMKNGLLRDQDLSGVLKTSSFSIPLVIGFGFATEAVWNALESSIDATEAIHALGALVGVLIGVVYLLRAVREPEDAGTG